ncbi:ABC transporter substrate-binding protein [Desulfobacula sp.]|uniref:ABC transporter substrate-binding protein n=1 Tax=Desulfobacula sp. TaxID=2593537 RepID=UPI0025C08C60|nr:ABC transporter substrate-binding protein [Desulfobacula sp.]MBC2703410.1 ABC transporter substrate-binding protein [Desulfobacula sp.]
MKKSTIITFLILSLFFLTGELFGEIIQDSTGKFITLNSPVKKIVVLTSDALEIVRAIKAEESVIGVYFEVSKKPLFWQDLKNRTKVGSWREVNYELIAKLKPDIVICYTDYPGRTLEKKLNPFGIKIIRLNFYKLNTIEKEIKTLGHILEREQDAEKLIVWYRENLNFVQEKLKHIESRPSVYIEGYLNYNTVGKNSGGNEMCLLAGGNNIASNILVPYPKITSEWVLSNNPDIIIKAVGKNSRTSADDLSSLKQLSKKIQSRILWDNIEAVHNNKVFLISNEIWTGSRTLIGLSYMAKWFYPKLFKDFDPEKLHKEYFEKFQGIKFYGTYIY